MNVKAIGKNKTGRVISPVRYVFMAVLFLVIEGLLQYFIYHYFAYVQEHPHDSIILSIMTSSQTLFTKGPGTGIIMHLVNKVWSLDISIWYVHLMLIAVIVLEFQKFGDFKGVEYGSGSWATKKDLQQFKNPDHTIPLAKGMYVDPQDSTIANLNELVIGGSGSRKTYGKIKPEIMQLLGSYIVTDPKGELYRDTAKMLKANGYKVKVLNLIDNLQYSNTYNPLYYVRKEKDAYTLAECCIKNTARGSNEQPFWEDSIKLLLQSMILYLYKEPNEKRTFGRILDLITGIRTHPRTGEILPDCEIEIIMNNLEKENEYDPAVKSYNQFKNAARETLQSIIISLEVRLTLWNGKDINILTGSDEMELDKIGEEKTAIFLLISDTDTTFKVIASMFFAQFFQIFCFNADMLHQGSSPLLVSCEIDEFANIGVIPNFKEIISTIRSRNGRIVPVIQAISQLRDLYKDATDTIIANCFIINYLGTKDEKTQKYVINSLLGNTTVRVDTSSKSQGTTQGSSSDSTNYTKRELMTADELNLLARRNNSIVHIEGYRPFFCQKYDTQNHKNNKLCGGSTKYAKDPAILAKNSILSVDYAELAVQHVTKFDDYLKQRKSEKNKNITEYMKDEDNNQQRLKEEMDAEFHINGDDKNEGEYTGSAPEDAASNKLKKIEKLKNAHKN